MKVEAIQQLQDAQVEPDVWGIEGLDRREDYEKVVAAARRGGRDKVGCIILPDAGNQEKVTRMADDCGWECRGSSVSPCRPDYFLAIRSVAGWPGRPHPKPQWLRLVNTTGSL